jgi:hypothetical protein
MYLLPSSGILTEIAYTVLTFHVFTTSPIMNYEASHNVRFSAELFIMFPAPLLPRIYYIQLSILLNFLTLLTLVHEDSQFNNYDKNITLLFAACLHPQN